MDTGSAFTLMQESRWKEISGMHDEIQNVKQNFVMAEGKMHLSKGQVELKYEWHQESGKVKVYINGRLPLGLSRCFGIRLFNSCWCHL